jgi:hypothetical protein
MEWGIPFWLQFFKKNIIRFQFLFQFQKSDPNSQQVISQSPPTNMIYEIVLNEELVQRHHMGQSS